ncbi:MAG: hypothetical protein U0Y82_05625 [Thermoleophilia bacterium]
MSDDRDPRVARALDGIQPAVSPEPDWGDVVRRQERRATSPPAPRGVRRWAPSLVSTAVAVGLIGVLFLHTDRHASTGGGVDPRSGVRAVVQVVSTRPDQTDAQAAAREAQMLGELAHAQGIDGFRAASDGDRVTVFMPRTQEPGYLRNWLVTAGGLEVVDMRGATLAQGKLSSPGDLGRVVRAVAAATLSPPSSFYLVANDAPVLGPLATRSAAATTPVIRGTRAGRHVVGVPSDVLITSLPHGVAAIRRGPVTPGDIEKVTVEADEVHVQVGPGAAARVQQRANPVFRMVERSGSIPQLVAQFRFAGFDAATRTLRFAYTPPAAQGIVVTPQQATDEVAKSSRAGGADALIGIASVAAVGPALPRPGIRPTTIPSFIRGVADLSPELSTVREVLQGTDPDGRAWHVYAYRLKAIGEVISTDGGTGGCPVDPAQPAIVPCMGGGGSGTHVLVGRTGPGVASITVTYANAPPATAAVGNGYFRVLLHQTDIVKALIATDSAGRRLGRLTPADAGGELLMAEPPPAPSGCPKRTSCTTATRTTP